MPIRSAPDFDKRIIEAIGQEEKAAKTLETASKQRESVSQAIKGIGGLIIRMTYKQGAGSPEDVSCLSKAIFQQLAGSCRLFTP